MNKILVVYVWLMLALSFAPCIAMQRDDASLFSCSICRYDDTTDSTMPAIFVMTECQHVFHSACLQSWHKECLTQQLGTTCPVCRCVLAGNDDALCGSEPSLKTVVFTVVFGGVLLTVDCVSGVCNLVQHLLFAPRISEQALRSINNAQQVTGR